MLTQEQTRSIKSQLINHIDVSFPEDKKQFAISQIENMDSAQLEEFVIKNNLMKKEGANNIQSKHCVFCSIILGDIKAYKIAENSKAVAVLEINPVSRGHVLIIPKEHITSEKDLPEQVSILSKKVSSIVRARLKPKEVRTIPSNVMGHEIFNVIPFYHDEKEPGERKPATQEELEEMQRILRRKSVIRKSSEEKRDIKKRVNGFEEKIWLPKRIP